MGVLMHECTGGNMRLYTICIDQRPVLVMSTDAEPPMEDTLTTDAKLMKAHRDMQALRAKMQARLPDAERLADQREIDEALDTWLGEDLHSFGLLERRLGQIAHPRGADGGSSALAHLAYASDRRGRRRGWVGGLGLAPRAGDRFPRRRRRRLNDRPDAAFPALIRPGGGSFEP